MYVSPELKTSSPSAKCESRVQTLLVDLQDAGHSSSMFMLERQLMLYPTTAGSERSTAWFA